MATYENTRLLIDGARGGGIGISRGVYRITTFVTDLAQTFANWNSARRTRKQLAKLSDYMLEDIGLTRGDIASFSAGRRFR
ncbi:MAG: hypothetical protein COB39_04500 [Marinosulfonomonas sp.]|nr:MAG: hypothetical protein COB39_04500 [Marinosulfonomonas sp.]